MSKAKILVVDDEEIMVDTISDILMMSGDYDVDAELDAEKAIEKLKEHEYALVVSDLRMPGMSGYEFYRWIKEHKPELTGRILFTSGDIYDPETREFLETEAVKCLSKPFDITEFMTVIREIVS